MEPIFQSGIAFITWLQGLGAWLVIPMKLFSFLGTEEFFLLALPIIYWSVDAKAGLRVGTILLLSGGLNDILKLSFQGPRPYWLSTHLKAFAPETSFGIPSGHAQIAASLWGLAASLVKRPWAYAAAVFIIFMIGLSRLYLAAHFPHDVLVGWALGALVLWAFVHWWDAVAARAKKKSPRQQVGLAFVLSMAMLVSGVITFASLHGWVMPADWMANARQAGADPLPAPVTLNNAITFAATLFGMLAGLVWTESKGGYVSDGGFWQRGVRLLPGLAGLLIIYLGLRAIFPRGDSFVPYVLRYLRFALIGLWISAGAPWLFMKLKLARSLKPM
ncbi:MAG: phosphoesterase PA-phosphatase [Deltaproteobacteria bacterium HGW-Deltaproteobacteria-19]|jgi:membrane-associated phospholipid phosphatase|nr:MAG: phosphoesterase PA-phosphatase [Deltaproteobacteria bacterium HGW-Deltaproteobacteria-19]